LAAAPTLVPWPLAGLRLPILPLLDAGAIRLHRSGLLRNSRMLILAALLLGGHRIWPSRKQT